MVFCDRQDYKVNPGGAMPYATVSTYDELVGGKGLGLIRADVTPNLTKKVRHEMQARKLVTKHHCRMHPRIHSSQTIQVTVCRACWSRPYVCVRLRVFQRT